MCLWSKCYYGNAYFIQNVIQDRKIFCFTLEKRFAVKLKMLLAVCSWESSLVAEKQSAHIIVNPEHLILCKMLDSFLKHRVISSIVTEVTSF